MIKLTLNQYYRPIGALIGECTDAPHYGGDDAFTAKSRTTSFLKLRKNKARRDQNFISPYQLVICRLPGPALDLGKSLLGADKHPTP